MTEDQLRRLTWLVSGVVLVALASLAAWHAYEAREEQGLVEYFFNSSNDWYSKCDKTKDSLTCAWGKEAADNLHEAATRRDAHDDDAQVFAILSGVAPLMLICLSVGGFWVIRGRVPRLIGKTSER